MTNKKRAKKAATKSGDSEQPTAESSTGPQEPKGSEGKPADPNPTQEKEAVASGYDLDTGEFIYNNSDRRITGLSRDVLVVVNIPKIVPQGETQAVWIANAATKPKVLNAPAYPARIPKHRADLYEVRSTSVTGQGLFAKQDISRGEIIFAERPLLVIPEFYVDLSTTESLLEAAIAHLPAQSQADFRALPSVYTRDECGPLHGKMRTCNHTLRNLFDGSDSSPAANYKIVCKIASRINHSCVSNVKHYFKVPSFSVQFFALRDIKAGDQLFYPYCLTDRSRAQRQADLVGHRFVCKCPGCLNATPETDKLRTTFKTQIAFFREALINGHRVDERLLERALSFEKEALKEGLDADDEYLMLLVAISAGYSKLGKMAESREYTATMEKFKKFIQDEWKGLPIPQM